MVHEHGPGCKELQEALADARARQTPPQRDTAIPAYQNVHAIEPGNTSPDATPELEQEIRNLEQMLRDMGCEPR